MGYAECASELAIRGLVSHSGYNSTGGFDSSLGTFFGIGTQCPGCSTHGSA
jgi:hypothetical protein